MIYPILIASTIFNGLTNLVATVLVYRKAPQGLLRRALLTFYFFGMVWAFGYFFPLTQHSEPLSMLSFQILHVGALFLSVSHLHFVCVLLDVHHQQRWVIRLGYLFNVCILPFVFTSYFIPDLVTKGPLTFYPNVGWVYSLWLGVWGAFFIYSIVLEFWHYRQKVGIQKLQLRFLIAADLLAFAFGSTNFLLAYDVPFPPYLTAFASLHVIILTYVILKYRFMDIRVTFSNWGKEFFSYLFALFCAFVALALSSSLTLPFDLIIVSTVFLLAYLNSRRFFDGPNFYKLFQLTDIVHLKRVLDGFVSQNTFYEHVADLNEELEVLFCGQLKYSSVRVLPLINKEEYPHLRRHFLLHKDSFLVTKEELFQQSVHKHSHAYLKELESLGELCFPLFKAKNELLGFFVLGKKPFDDVYMQSELPLLEQFAHYLALLLGMTLYNVHLQREIARKTLALREQNAEVKKLYELEKETTALLSHELKTPIAMVSNTHWYLEQFLNEHELDLEKTYVPLKAFSLEMKEGLQKLNSICNSIFHLREVEYQMSKELQILDWPRQIIPLLDTMQQKAEAKKIKFFYESKIPTGTFYGACIQFEQVLTILLDNAVKYTDKGKVHLTLYVQDNSLFCSVRDTGPGVSPDLQHTIFKRFYRAKGAKTKQGLGLGLYIAKKILDQIGGSISVNSKAKKGSEFVIALPLTVK